MTPTPEAGQLSITDQTVKLSCGCLVIYPRRNLDMGRMFYCKRHLKIDPFNQLRMLEQVTQQVKAGETKIDLGVI